MAVKQTAGRDSLGKFALNLQNLMTMYFSVKYGQEKINFHFVTAHS